MILSDRQIKTALQSGRIVISPEPTMEQYAPSAVDLHVADEFKRWKTPPAGMLQHLRLTDVKLPDCEAYLDMLPLEDDETVTIAPGAFVLSRTVEKVALPPDSRLAARVEGRSSYARLGLVVHMTAPTIHAGFSGHIVLEMMNFGPFSLKIDPHRTLLCQLIFEELGDDPDCTLNTPFQGQNTVTG
ncbi:MAG: dCTP deaminase [Planctomycetes bacterium]|jgi:dCTP deaminase|nr:dCTP deaminase [Planctomycetota bacterium]